MNYFDESFHCDSLDEALSLTGANIRTFGSHDAISCRVIAEAAYDKLLSKEAREVKLRTGIPRVPCGARRMTFARRLDVLPLQFEKENDKSHPFSKSQLLGLRVSLKTMPNLRTMDLCFPAETVTEYGHLFPKNIVWPNLTAFRIKGKFLAHAHAMVDLHLVSMAELGHLCVESMNLLSGK